MPRKSKHRKGVEYIANNPSEFEIPKPIFVAIEPKLYDTRGRLVAEPDIYMQVKSGEIYIVEYKSSDRDRLKRRAEQQLYNAIRWCTQRGITPRTMVLNGEVVDKKMRRKKRRPKPYDRKTIRRRPVSEA